MRKARAVSLCCCLAALPLIGCAADVGAVRPPPVPLAAPATAASAPRVYAAGGAAPAAILVVLPGVGALAADPALWASQGFDLVTPPPEFLRVAADREAALAQLVASARALADAPVWLVGPDPAIEAALAGALPGGGVSGVVVTAAGPSTGTCTESFSYFDPGTGAPPQMSFKKSGDACPGGPSPSGSVSGPAFGTGRPATLPPPVPAVRPQGPRIIEASAASDKMSPPARKAYVRQLAELIRQAPPG
jgi:hypothetical protein